MEKKKKFEATVSGFALSVVTPDVVIENNVEKLVEFIQERMSDYNPESYMGDADMARKDRAELNKGAEQVKSVRQSIQALNPYGDVIARLADAEKLIKGGADRLGDIVRAKDNEEKEAKRKLIQTEWDSRKFDLFSLDKVFNPKWLNKTFKMADVAAEIGAIIDRTYRDLKTIEKFSSDADTLKAHYLMNLDIADTLDYGEELQKKRQLAEKEMKQRAEREHLERIEEQKKEIRIDSAEIARRASIAALVEEASGEKVDRDLTEYVIAVKVTETQLVGIKNYLTMQGVEYECNELRF